MNIISVGDEVISLRYFTLLVSKIPYIDSHKSFMNPFEALQYAQSTTVDVAFLDIELPGMSGIDLAKALKEINSETKIVFVTRYSQYALDAFGVEAMGYVLKPYSQEDIEREISKALRSITEKSANSVQIKTFGDFKVFINDQQIIFKWAKTKELLAILIDRKGAYVSSDEMIAILFENQPITDSIKSYYRNIRCNLNAILKENNAEEIFLQSRGYCSINRSKIDCDYFDYLQDKPSAKALFKGEYMNGYSWAKSTLEKLMNNA